MDRVNRRFLVASIRTAIPVALLMASLTNAAESTTRQAVAQTSPSDEAGAIQQVAGKQLSSGNTRPGLFQVMAGSKPKGNVNHQHRNMPRQEPRGLFDGLFGGGKKAPAETAPRELPKSQDPSQAEWDGIPYHGAVKKPRSTASAPIRDPNRSATPVPNSARIVRGGSTRSEIAPRPSTRSAVPTPPAPRPELPKIAKRSTTAVPIPAPSQDKKIAVIRTEPTFSSDSSSRRSGRREVHTFNATEANRIATSAPVAVTKTTPSDDATDVVPRVSRRTLATETDKVAKSEKAKTPEAKASDVSETAKVAAKPIAEKTKVATATPPVETEVDAPLSPAPAATTKVVAKAPSAVLSAPSAVPMPSYNTPVDPSNVAAGTQPYAASIAMPTHGSTTANSVSHRAGPPAAAFVVPGSDPLPTQRSQPTFGTASAAIGSGIAQENAAYRRSTLEPAFETAQRPTHPYVDPYQNRAQRLDQPKSVLDRSAATGRPVHETTVPIHPINGYQATNGQQTNGYQSNGYQATGERSKPAVPPGHNASDNFGRSTLDSRNRMRNGLGSSSSSGVVASELPGIRVVTHGPDSIMIRQSNEYEIRVENRGSIDADGLIVRALIPDWAEVSGQNATRGNVDNQGQGATERLVWTIDHLPAGASEQMFVRLTAMRSGTYNLDVDWTCVPQKSVAQVQVREPRLDLTIEGPEEVVYGQSQTYKVRVLNPGDGIAPNVVFTLSPNSATPQTQRIGDIPPGKEAQFDVELTAQDLGDLKIHGLATADLELRAEADKTIRVSAAQLEAMLNGPELKYQNTEAMYNLKVQNGGSATSEKVVATLRIPAGVKYLGGIEGATQQANLLKWEINMLSPGATRDYQFRCSMQTNGEHLFAFDCKGTAAGQAGVTLATRVESIADLVLSINDPPAPAPIGTEVVYEIVVRNRGSKEAQNVIAIAQFSNGIEPKRIEGQSGEVVTGQVLFDPIPRIGAGEEVRLRVVAIADQAGHHRFRSEVSSGDTVLVAEEATHYMSPQSDRVSRSSNDNLNR